MKEFWTLWSLLMTVSETVIVETIPYSNIGLTRCKSIKWLWGLIGPHFLLTNILEDVRSWMSIFPNYHCYFVLTSLAILSFGDKLFGYDYYFQCSLKIARIEILKRYPFNSLYWKRGQRVLKMRRWKLQMGYITDEQHGEMEKRSNWKEH